MSKRILAAVMLVALLAGTAAAQHRVIVRTGDGLDGVAVINNACLKVKCKVGATLDGNNKKLFVVTSESTTTTSSGGLLGGVVNSVFSLLSFITQLLNQPGISAAEPDQLLNARDENDATSSEVPAALYDKTLVDYYGTTVRRGYLQQPAAGIVGLNDARRTYGVTGRGTVVAVIDTGVDPEHPALKAVLLPGYDFVNNLEGGSETADLDRRQSTAAMVDGRQSTAAMVDDSQPAFVNQSTAAMVDQSTAAMVDNPEFAAFGHGTMVAGVVHLVAPEAKIMPLKAFKADGSGYASDIIRAMYFAAQNGAHVMNMSFSFKVASPELKRVVDHAARRGIILVAAAGNNGIRTDVWPASYDNVIGVAATTNRDFRASFSNYGTTLVWVAAPGEGVVAPYPLGHYAAAWGTSFSTPMVAGTAALLRSVKPLNEDQAELAVSNAKWVGLEMGTGRVDIFRAVQYWRQLSGIR